jgi:hypothetical protein
VLWNSINSFLILALFAITIAQLVVSVRYKATAHEASQDAVAAKGMAQKAEDIAKKAEDIASRLYDQVSTA